MNEIILMRRFLDELAEIESDALRDKIFDLLDLLPYVPVLGSSRIPASLEERYGVNARKIVIPPFDILYSVDEEGDFLILALVHQRMAR